MFVADHAVVLQNQLVVSHAHEGHLLGVIPWTQEGDVALLRFAENQVVDRLSAKIQTIAAGAEAGDHS